MPNRPLLLLSLFFATAAFADSSDLRLHVQTSNEFSVLMVLVNDGPDTARNVVVTAEFPPALTVTRASFDAKACTVTPGAIRCELGDVTTAFPPKYGGFEFERLIADATHTVTARVTSDTPDPATDNNAGSASWTTRIEADLSPFIRSNTDRVDPGGSANFQAFICNNTQNNRVPERLQLDLSVTNGVFESLTPSEGFTCTVNGATATCTGANFVHERCTHFFEFMVLTDTDREGGAATVTATATSEVPDPSPENNSLRASASIYRWIGVNTTADAGPGSLRDAIDQANGGCSTDPCRIVFEIPAPVPAEGWFTITPATPFPGVTANRVALEGRRQTMLTGDTNPKGPEIAIDGRLAREGLKLFSSCEAVVEGLAIGNFDADQGLLIAAGNQPCGIRPDRREVTYNHLGVDPTGTVPWPNFRGLIAGEGGLLIAHNIVSHNVRSGIWMWRGLMRAHDNRLEHNGASGFFLGPEVGTAELLDNTVATNREMGVAVARGAKLIDIRGNSMKDNGGLGIDWGLDGVSRSNADDRNGASNAPVLLSARYDAGTNMTLVTVDITSTPLGTSFNGGVIDVYANASPDGDGEVPIGGIQSFTVLGGTVTVSVRGDHRGKWLNATWTRVHWLGAKSPKISSQWFAGGDAHTSELSNAVLVE